ncbi:uncharacterized protein CTRU02_211576 [Colletotrichum truncatum]|uniref:Uncharacterized protein n=1 Tax=Colletotrichum truncatum TaxID=5467 RepID=A0ACC3YL22_COLTU|nr:uncharacterized protein CTRU02_14082 [Colletotrichum truncatum]KAF6782601.1 hypothetical protein CTRU02_14082 [Colletotrichum truncatum]
MQLSTLIGASFLAVASAQNTSYAPINLGYYYFPRGNFFVAWSPFTPTKTQEVVDTCLARGAVQGTATWSTIRERHSGYVLGPICRNPFNVTNDETGETYYNLELACTDDNIPIEQNPTVTAVVDVASNKVVQTCVPAVVEGGETATCNTWTGLEYAFACSS